MDLATLVVDVVIALWVIAVLVAVLRAWQARTPGLAPLAPETRDRYVQTWRQIAATFIHSPHEAARQADALVMSLLRERGHPLDHERLPRQMIDARRSRLVGEERGETEALRQAFLHYRAAFERAVGRPGREAASDRRREMA